MYTGPTVLNIEKLKISTALNTISKAISLNFKLDYGGQLVYMFYHKS